MYIRLMQRTDVSQVAKIDREAFPTEWPPTNFYRELENRMAYYLVASKGPVDNTISESPVPEHQAHGLLERLIRFLTRRKVNPVSNSEETIIGFAGMWIMADEAHIMSIASREQDRRTGIGEGLLMAVFQMAQQHKARVVTLEVRVSNTSAQNLYLKYGFQKTGIRKGYYLDNKEDAIIMTTDHVGSHAFKEKIQNLTDEHMRKWGEIHLNLTKQKL